MRALCAKTAVLSSQRCCEVSRATAMPRNQNQHHFQPGLLGNISRFGNLINKKHIYINKIIAQFSPSLLQSPKKLPPVSDCSRQNHNLIAPILGPPINPPPHSPPLHPLVASRSNGSPPADQVGHQDDHDKGSEGRTNSNGNHVLDLLVRLTVVVWEEGFSGFGRRGRGLVVWERGGG